MLLSLLNLNVRTLIAILFWGNLTSVLMILAYEIANGSQLERKLFRFFLLAKLTQAFAYLLLFYRGEIADLLSVNVGNSLLILGFYLESLTILVLIHERRIWLWRLVGGLTIVALLLFNGMEYYNHSYSFRVFTGSICVFMVLLLPALRLLASWATSLFKRTVGLFYLVFLCLLLPRAFYAFTTPFELFTDSLVQSLTFLSLVVLMVFSLSTYLLLMKEKADKIICTMASTDNLTGLPNRYFFLDAAEMAFARHQEAKLPLAVLFMDIDGFKSINDTHGHVFGDQVLIVLGQCILGSLRSGDLSCRYGGEEFLVFLSGADADNAAKVAERIREHAAQSVFWEKPEFRFTLSIGVACGVPSREETLMRFIEYADAAMYLAKQTGKNRVMEYRPEE